jgi:hypothetical protein
MTDAFGSERGCWRHVSWTASTPSGISFQRRLVEPGAIQAGPTAHQFARRKAAFGNKVPNRIAIQAGARPRSMAVWLDVVGGNAAFCFWRLGSSLPLTATRGNSHVLRGGASDRRVGQVACEPITVIRLPPRGRGEFARGDHDDPPAELFQGVFAIEAVRATADGPARRAACAPAQWWPGACGSKRLVTALSKPQGSPKQNRPHTKYGYLTYLLGYSGLGSSGVWRCVHGLDG